MAHFRAFCGPLGAIAQLGERLVRNEEVGGSIPPGSTSFAASRLRLASQRFAHRRLSRHGVAKRRRLPVEAACEDGPATHSLRTRGSNATNRFAASPDTPHK